MGGYPPAPTTGNYTAAHTTLVIRTYNVGRNVVETREYVGDFKEP